jgi:hypothetical protein
MLLPFPLDDALLQKPTLPKKYNGTLLKSYCRSKAGSRYKNGLLMSTANWDDSDSMAVNFTADKRTMAPTLNRLAPRILIPPVT